MALTHSRVGEGLRTDYPPEWAAYPVLRKIGWAGARVFFVLTSALGVVSVAGCYLLSPLFTYWFFGSFRFWRYLHLTPAMIVFSYHLAYLSLQGRAVCGIPWTAPPASRPDKALVRIRPDWPDGESCGSCGRCCKKIRCPLQDRRNGQCMSYNSFYWRYFNCGRYPTSTREILLYDCPKWIMKT